jgi:MinD-like ATPase involved in chromosome partitioning or flagellar assembly
MHRPTIAVALPPEEREAVLAHLAAAEFGTVGLESAAELPEVLRAELPVGLAIIDASIDPAGVAEALLALRAGPWAVPVLVVADGDGLDGLLEVGGLGPDDELVLRPIDPETLRWRAEAMLIRAQVAAEATGGAVLAKGTIEAEWAARTPIITVFNPKGGVGKTTIATNLASALQNRRDHRVLLLDGDTVTGHVTLSLGMETGRTLTDAWLDQDEGGPAEGLLDIASVHESGIRVAALVSSPLAMSRLDPERVAEAILAARRGVDAIVVDLHPSYSDVNQTVFSIADRILVPVTPDLPAIRAAVQLCEVATELGVRDRLALVINRANSGVSVAQIEQAIGMPALAQIRSGGMLFVKAANEGRTVTDLFPREGVSGDFETLADRLLGLGREGQVTATAPSAPRTLLGGLFGRKEPIRA